MWFLREAIFFTKSQTMKKYAGNVVESNVGDLLYNFLALITIRETGEACQDKMIWMNTGKSFYSEKLTYFLLNNPNG